MICAFGMAVSSSFLYLFLVHQETWMLDQVERSVAAGKPAVAELRVHSDDVVALEYVEHDRPGPGPAQLVLEAAHQPAGEAEPAKVGMHDDAVNLPDAGRQPRADPEHEPFDADQVTHCRAESQPSADGEDAVLPGRAARAVRGRDRA